MSHCPQQSFLFSQLQVFPVSSESYRQSVVHFGHQELENSGHCQKVTTVQKICNSFWARRDSIERNSYGNVAGWLAVRHSRYCIKTTKPILKLFGPSGSPII